MFVAAAAAAVAQQTWIVDPSGSGNFTSPAAAIAAASPGDTIRLRGGGQYTTTSFTVDKRLAILGEGPARTLVRGFDVVAGLNGTVQFAGFDAGSVRSYSPISCEDLAMSSIVLFSTLASFHRCTIGGHTNLLGGANTGDVGYISQSRATFADCNLHGGVGYSIQTLVCRSVPPAAAIQSTRSDITLSNCVLVGGTGFSWAACPGTVAPAGLALADFWGTVRITHCSLSGALDGAGVLQPAMAVSFGTQLLVDATTTFQPAFNPGANVFLPGIEGLTAGPGGTMRCTVTSDPSLAAAMVASLGLRAPTPLPEGPGWIDPGAFVVLRIGFTDPGGRFPVSVPLPTGVPSGLAVTFQGAVLSPAGVLTGSAPVVMQVL